MSFFAYLLGLAVLSAWVVVVNRLLIRPSEVPLVGKVESWSGANEGEGPRFEVELPNGENVHFGVWESTFRRHEVGDTIVVSWRPGGPFGPHIKYGRGLKLYIGPLLVAAPLTALAWVVTGG